MTIAVRLLAAALLLQSAAPRDDRPLPEAGPFLEAVRANLARSQEEQNRYAYKERRTELDLNPFGHLGTGETRVIAVTPTEGGKAVTRQLIERDGIIPAPYMARNKWVTLERFDALPDKEIKGLVRHSYEMILAKLPKKVQAQLNQDSSSHDR